MTEGGSVTPLGAALLRSGELAARPDVEAPDAATLDLPEKVVQFGTGAFLRGFVGFFIDEANRQHRFNGRIVAVASTGSGRERTLTRQDGLYTLAVQGVSRGVSHSSRRVITAYSRALSAQRQWNEVLALARRPELELVFSNTTEAGIVLDPDDTPAPAAPAAPAANVPPVSPERDEIASAVLDGASLPSATPPRSFPGKLTMFLYERGRAFGYARDRGVVVLPCELIEDNGERLREIVLTLAQRWRLEPAFGEWVERAVPICNTLVDRIVPGTPGAAALERAWTELRYRDELLTVSEDYRLFAIEADAAVRERLTFAAADPGIILTDDVTPFRERKVRLLNGTHTLLAPVGLLCGCRTVKDAIDDPVVGAFVRGLVVDELTPTVDAEAAEAFALDVLDRFANPFLDHALADITLQQTAKLRIRLIPALAAYTRRTGRPPAFMAFGFAAWLFFMRPDLQEERERNTATRRADDRAGRVAALWKQTGEGAFSTASGDWQESAGSGEADASQAVGASALVRVVLSDASLWGADLTRIAGLAHCVTEDLIRIERDGARAALQHRLAAASPLEGTAR